MSDVKLQRRILRFESLQEAVDDATNLLDHGYERAGNWSLGQCCQHLSQLIQYPMDGFPNFPIWMRIPMWVLRYTYAPRMLRKILEQERWPEKRIPTDENSVPNNHVEDEAGVTEFQNSANRLTNFQGTFKASPLLGFLDKPELLKLHRIHAAHHLGFLIPKNE